MITTKHPITYWRVEGSLVNLGAVHPLAFFTWNSQSFSERWARRGAVGLLTILRPFINTFDRTLGTRLLYAQLCGISQDRLDLLGEEYFHFVLKPRLRLRSINKIKEMHSYGHEVVLVSHGLEHIVRPLAEHVGVKKLVANQLEFRDGVATGRLLDPVIRPPGFVSRLSQRGFDGTVSNEQLAADLDITDVDRVLAEAAIPPQRRACPPKRPIVLFDSVRRPERFSVRDNFAGKHVLLVGSTGFIGKVWLAHALSDIPALGRLYLLIRGGRTTSAEARFERMISESPVFESFHKRHGAALADFLDQRVEVLQGDITLPDLGLDPATAARLHGALDLVVNSSGLTDFNPDLRTAVNVNVDGTLQLLDFVKRCRRASLLHLSTCYVAGSRDGRIREQLLPDYTPCSAADFDPERELQHLRSAIEAIDRKAESDETTEFIRREILERHTEDPPAGAAFERLLERRRAKWLRTELTKIGMSRATDWGWPNTYCFTKSLAESLIIRQAEGRSFAIVRPAIVETSTRSPFRGWNEGVNTSAPLSHLLGTYFRQLPTNERKCLDIVPVDVVCRGMSLIGAALLQGCHQPVYQLGTSSVNPCSMRRSIELTGLAHRKHYRQQKGLQAWLRLRCETIPVSMSRYKRFSAPSQKAMVHALNKLTSSLTFKEQTPCLSKTEHGLQRVEKLIELYEPFILHHEQVFEAENVRVLSSAIPDDEQEQFGYDAASNDWWDYWINIHIPALRRWSFPLLEGQVPPPAPRYDFKLKRRDGEASAPRALATPQPAEKAWASS
jgi:long-chain acyl-CoA synthetase